jgi:hypothetical protein
MSNSIPNASFSSRCNCCLYDLDAIYEYKSCQGFNLCCPEEVLLSKISLAISIIEGITGVRLCPYSDCKSFQVNSGEKIIFYNPNTSNKLLEVQSVSMSSCDENFELHDFIAEKDRIKMKCGSCFPCGELKICGLWGDFEQLPQYFREAVYLLALEKAQPGVTGLSASQGLVDKIEWPDFKLTYNNSIINTPDIQTTGYYEIDRLISVIPTSAQIKFSVVGDGPNKFCRYRGEKQC